MVPSLSVLGLALSLVGAALDFASGTKILQAALMPAMPIMGMGSATANAFAWSFLLYILGGLLIATGVLGVTRVGMGRMHIFGALMAVYGIAMLMIGALMLAGFAPMMQGADLSAAGMLIVGLGMIINGLAMATRRGMKSEM